MSRLASKTVLRGLVAVWFLAASPIKRSVSVKATYDGGLRQRVLGAAARGSRREGLAP